MKAFNLIAFIFYFTIVNGGNIMDIMEDCGSTGGSIIDLDLEGCDGDYDDYCEIHMGKLFREKMTFSATSAAVTLECNVFLVVYGIEIPVSGNCQGIDPCSVSHSVFIFRFYLLHTIYISTYSLTLNRL